MVTSIHFLAMASLSALLPVCIYVYLLRKRAISGLTIALLGLTLVAIASVDVYLLQLAAAKARQMPPQPGNFIFLSELSVALYLFPALFGGLGLNMISHVLMAHLVKAQKRFHPAHPMP